MTGILSLGNIKIKEVDEYAFAVPEPELQGR
jgi:hypothetical protein